MSDDKQRDYLFDNYKALLIVLVVIGHFIDLNYNNNGFLYTLKWLIVSFHMPAFLFISGYFSKKTASAGTLVRKLIVPYFVYEAIYYLLYTLILHKETKLYLLFPKFSLWYILALFFYRLAAPYIRKIPHYMVVSIVAGLLIGCSDMPSNFLSLPRILVFYPFFLAGMAFNRDTLTRLQNKTCRIIASAGILAFLTFLIFDPYHKKLSPKIFYGRYNYDYLGQTNIEGMLCRLICYAVGFLMTFGIMLFIYEKKTFYSYLGGRTMAIYLFHGLIFSCLKFGTNILPNVNTAPETILLLIFCLGLVWIFSAPPPSIFVGAIANIHLPRRNKPLLDGVKSNEN